jgi:hypothetical protein
MAFIQVRTAPGPTAFDLFVEGAPAVTEVTQ